MLPDPALSAAFLIASLVVIVAPGPDVLYVVSRSIGQGRWAGIVAVAGTSSGLLVHASAAALGLSGLFLHAPLAYEVLRYAGVAYLLYLAWRAFTARDAPELPRREGAQAPVWWRVYRQAALTNLLNPKVALFFIAFLPQFVDAQGSHAFAQITLLAALFVVAGAVFLLVLALAFGRIGDWLRARPGFWRAQRWIMGTTLGGLALWLALPERR
jgi:threonine/homoserine/homoserine lactone efflux protein